jgi:hypothetical protein
LLLEQPVSGAHALLLNARDALDGRGGVGGEQVVVGHLAGQFPDGREAQVDRRRGEALGEQPRAVAAGERF